jgi:hypothetical protein
MSALERNVAMTEYEKLSLRLLAFIGGCVAAQTVRGNTVAEHSDIITKKYQELVAEVCAVTPPAPTPDGPPAYRKPDGAK